MASGTRRALSKLTVEGHVIHALKHSGMIHADKEPIFLPVTQALQTLAQGVGANGDIILALLLARSLAGVVLQDIDLFLEGQVRSLQPRNLSSHGSHSLCVHVITSTTCVTSLVERL